jgi:hypothetical protein
MGSKLKLSFSHILMIVLFEKNAEGTKLTEQFEPEHENAEELQQAGWQAILDQFKQYVTS